jgi:16S rRNA (uracil1498-N3)-methyltransferase
MSERFFISQPITGDHARLAGTEAHHLLHVKRARTSDEVTLFDGSGHEFAAVVTSLGRTEVELRIVERRDVDCELPFRLTVGVALPKGDRQKWLVEKLTELGVAALVPLVTQRGVAQPAASALERLRRSVIEASKQCGRNRLMAIEAAENWSSWIEMKRSQSQSAIRNSQSEIPARRLLADPGGSTLSAIDLSTSAPTLLAVGPEGGLTEDEVRSAVAAGWQAVGLGPRILRVETAAIALAAAVVLK